jgi:hypothetical protein
MLTKPRWLLHLEGAALFVLAVWAYHANEYRWGLFAILFLAPDLFMLGYLVNTKWGSAFYNLAHTLAGPAVLFMFALLRMNSSIFPYALIWLAHIGFDRMLGYGLKYPTFFKDTHLQHV